MRCYFLVYEMNGKKGNDLTNIDPFRWLIQNRGKDSKSDLIVLRWLQIEVPQYEYDGLQSQIGIEHDDEKVEKPEEEIVDVVRSSPSPQEACNRLINKANEYGGEDNITVTLARMSDRQRSTP